MPDSANSRKRILRDSKNRAESADSSGFRANSRKRILRILKPCRIPANSRKRILRIPGTVPNAEDIESPDMNHLVPLKHHGKIQNQSNRLVFYIVRWRL